MRRRPDPPLYLPPGGKSLGINLEALAALTTPNSSETPNSSGRVIARFIVPHRPVPWKVNAGMRPNAALKTWNSQVRFFALIAMGKESAYPFEVELEMFFRLKFDRRQPDLTNLAKGTEDALQGIVIINDRSVKRTTMEMDDDADENSATIEVREYRKEKR